MGKSVQALFDGNYNRLKWPAAHSPLRIARYRPELRQGERARGDFNRLKYAIA